MGGWGIPELLYPVTGRIACARHGGAQPSEMHRSCKPSSRCRNTAVRNCAVLFTTCESRAGTILRVMRNEAA